VRILATRLHLPCLLALGVTGAWLPLAAAQTPPDAGALIRQIERDAGAQQPPRKTPELDGQHTRTTPAPGGVQFDVKSFAFTGNHLIDSNELAQVVVPWAGKRQDFAALQAAAAAVGEAYRARGWIVRAFLPRQEVREGVVRIEVVEAHLGRIYVDGQAAGRVPLQTVENFVGARLRHGDLLATGALDRGLMLADDLPGVVVAGHLLAGSTPGETDVALKLADESLVIGEVTADNYGARSTGSARIAGDVGLNSPLRFGDYVGGSVIHTRGSDYLRAEYTVPLGVQGIRLGASVSSYRYKLLTAPFEALDTHGSSGSVGLRGSVPVIRARKVNFHVVASWDHRSFDNLANGVHVTRYAVDDLTIAFNGNVFDDLGGGGANAFGLALISSRVDLAGSPSAAADAAGPNVGGTSAKVRVNLSRQQAVVDKFTLFASLSAQFSDRNQDSSEKFYLGGPYGVRAHLADCAAACTACAAATRQRCRWLRRQWLGRGGPGWKRNWHRWRRHDRRWLVVSWQRRSGPRQQWLEWLRGCGRWRQWWRWQR